ncbi:hypothetical protein R6Q57_019142 [Mikania cordata]
MNVKVWTTVISFTASRIFFFFIFFQIPLFRFPCRIGTCLTPMEVTSSQLIASEVIPSWVVKVLLFPGAIGKVILSRQPIHNYNNLLEACNLRNLKQASSTNDLQHIEVLAGSYLAVAGAMIGLVKSRRLGFFGMLLLIWGLFKEPRLSEGQSSFKHNKNAINIYHPTMSIAVISAFLSIREDVKLIVSCFNLNYDTTRSRPECEVGNEESGGSTKRSRTTEEGDYCVNSNPDLPTSGGSTVKRPTGRDSAKKKGKGKAYNEFAEELRAMRVTRDSEIELMRKRVELEQQRVQYRQERDQKKQETEQENMQLLHLNTLLAKTCLQTDNKEPQLKMMNNLFNTLRNELQTYPPI